MRAEVSDPAAQFFRVQVTGDDRTGQTCGYISAKYAEDGLNHTMRFIVYIDQTAGPYMEAGMGRHPIEQDDFERAWASDCVKEGYAS